MRKHASEIAYDECSFLGIPALLTDWRISRAIACGCFPEEFPQKQHCKEEAQ